MAKAYTKCYHLIFDKSHNYQKTNKSKHYSKDNAIVTSRSEFSMKNKSKTIEGIF